MAKVQSRRPVSLNRAALPPGWTQEAHANSDDITVITSAPSRYMATVDYKGRVFRSGLTAFGKPLCVRITGRDWRNRLTAKAVAFLTKLEQSK